MPVCLDLPKWFSPTVELKPPQPFKKRVSWSQKVKRKIWFVYTAKNLISFAADVVKQALNHRLKYSRLFLQWAVCLPPVTNPHRIITWWRAAWHSWRKACWKQLALSQFTKKEIDAREREKRGVTEREHQVKQVPHVRQDRRQEWRQRGKRRWETV